jgi:hypothetical protein
MSAAVAKRLCGNCVYFGKNDDPKSGLVGSFCYVSPPQLFMAPTGPAPIQRAGGVGQNMTVLGLSPPADAGRLACKQHEWDEEPSACGSTE